MNGLAEMDECETPEDDEPSLASLDRMADQTKWEAGGNGGEIDAELDESDDEDGRPGQPSLGSVGDVHFDQRRWDGGQRDLEQDGAESSIGDQDGLDEQVPFLDWQGVGMLCENAHPKSSPRLWGPF